MDCTCIPYTRLPKSSALFLDYLYHFDRVARFYSAPPFERSSYKTLAGKLQGFPLKRRELVEVLIRQNQAFGCPEATLANVRRLADPGVFAVVTGQQVGLLSGPAFTLFKALTAVRLARSLSEQGLPSVPVFWLATEDHDLEEVAQTATLDEDYALLPLKDTGESAAARASVGRVKLTGEITGALDRLEASLPAGGPRDRLLQDLRETYRPGVAWGDAFGRFIAKLFGRWGVVLIDPLDEAVHQLGAGIYKRAIGQARGLRKLLQDRSADLVRSGYNAQVHIADDSTLLFAERGGSRLAIHLPDAQRDVDFRIGDAENVAKVDLELQAQDHPLDFTPNALLRPVVQDALLPTLAYVAGPSEIAYLAQANSLYAEFGRPQPLIFPRAGFTLVDRRVARLLEKYRVSAEDVWRGEEHLRRKIAASGSVQGWSERFEQTEQEIARRLERLRQDIAAIDPTLVDSLKNAQEKILYQLDRLKGKASRATLERSELLARHEQTLIRLLTPASDLQERQVSGAYFLGRAGYEWLDRLLAQIQTQSSDHQALVY